MLEMTRLDGAPGRSRRDERVRKRINLCHSSGWVPSLLGRKQLQNDSSSQKALVYQAREVRSSVAPLSKASQRDPSSNRVTRCAPGHLKWH